MIRNRSLISLAQQKAPDAFRSCLELLYVDPARLWLASHSLRAHWYFFTPSREYVVCAELMCKRRRDDTSQLWWAQCSTHFTGETFRQTQAQIAALTPTNHENRNKSFIGSKIAEEFLPALWGSLGIHPTSRLRWPTVGQPFGLPDPIRIVPDPLPPFPAG